MKKLIKKYWLVIVIVIPVIVLVLFRSTAAGRFRYDAGKWAAPSLSGSNLITPEKALKLEGNILIVDLNKGNLVTETFKGRILKISPDSVLTGNYRKTLARNKGPILLYSADYAVSAKVWMVLIQSGFKDTYILTEDQDNELAKEKFRPDKVTWPEL